MAVMRLYKMHILVSVLPPSSIKSLDALIGVGDPDTLGGEIPHEVDNLLDKADIVISLNALTHNALGVTIWGFRRAEPVVVFSIVLIANRYIRL